jgi:hypothetical protein
MLGIVVTETEDRVVSGVDDLASARSDLGALLPRPISATSQLSNESGSFRCATTLTRSNP